jgi:hypothetical protein
MDHTELIPALMKIPTISMSGDKVHTTIEVIPTGFRYGYKQFVIQQITSQQNWKIWALPQKPVASGTWLIRGGPNCCQVGWAGGIPCCGLSSLGLGLTRRPNKLLYAATKPWPVILIAPATPYSRTWRCPQTEMRCTRDLAGAPSHGHADVHNNL